MTRLVGAVPVQRVIHTLVITAAVAALLLLWRQPVSALLAPDEHAPVSVDFAARGDGMCLEVRWKFPYPQKDYQLVVTLPRSLWKYPVLELFEYPYSEQQYLCYLALAIPAEWEVEPTFHLHGQKVVNEVQRYARVRIIEK